MKMKVKHGCIFYTFVVIFMSCHASINLYEDFVKFKNKFHKTYNETGAAFASRLNNYQRNQKLQLWLNKSQPEQTAWYGETKFSDLSQQEFKNLFLNGLIVKQDGRQANISTPLHRLRKLNTIPAKLDWRTYLNYSIVSAVKNQKKCGACWAFSTVETVESMYARQTGTTPPDLSVQEVIDCSRYNGCGGGDTCTALEWMVDTKTAIVSNAAYPLTDESNFCKIPTNVSTGLHVHVKKYACYNKVGKEDELLQLLQNGPVSAAVDATTWNNYQGGIIQYHCGYSNNHAIQIVGYDTTGAVPFYIVRNSWGTDYGHEGYLYIKVGDNVCGIAKEIATVEVLT